MHAGHLIYLGASPIYPLSASTRSESSNSCSNADQKIEISGHFPHSNGPLIHTIIPVRIHKPISYLRPLPLNL